MALPAGSVGRTLAFLLFLVLTIGASGAKFRSFNLPCLAPLFDDLDAEAPASVSLAFLQGPHRAPALRDDIGSVEFPITINSKEAASYFNQGVALIHGLSHREAERSFRQALLLDPENPMIFWGLAVANERRPERARLFTHNAVRRIGNETTARERLWIDVLANFYDIKPDGPAKLPPAEPLTSRQVGERHQQHTRDLETIALAYPKDVEAKAFLLRRLTLDHKRSGIPVTSHVAVDTLARQLATLAPTHPSRHYGILLWLTERPQEALRYAEKSASLAPGVADSWRYAGEAWRNAGEPHKAVPFLKAALRVDHRRIQEELLMPERIENLESNYAALVDNLSGMGVIEEALQWTDRMLALPRKIEPIANPDSSSRALFALSLRVTTLLRAEQFGRLLKDLKANPALLRLESDPRVQGHVHYWRGLGLAALDRFEECSTQEQKLAALAGSSKHDRQKQEILWLTSQLTDFRKLRQGVVPKRPLSFQPRDVPRCLLAHSLMKAGASDEALTMARTNLDERPGQLFATAAVCELNLQAGKVVPAMAAFDRSFRESAMRADEALAPLARLAPLASRMQLPKQWKLPVKQVAIPGAPTDPSNLGPEFWTPAPAPGWTLPDHAKKNFSLRQYRGKAVLVTFFLGVDCPYCMTQLNRFRSHLEAFEKEGIGMIGISADSQDVLAKRLGDGPGRTKFPFPIVADPELQTFKAYGVFDDFEAGPMHATFLIGPSGGVLWSDVSHAPFNQPEALLQESERLLNR